MKHLILLLTAVFAAFGAPPSPPAKPTKPKIAVLKFENDSRTQDSRTIEVPAGVERTLPFLPVKSERYAELARSELENVLTGWDELNVLERERADVAQRELDLNRSRGGRRDRDENALRLDGVTHIVYGQLSDISTEQSRFTGYGIMTDSKVTSVVLRIRVIEVASEKVVYSTTVVGHGEQLRTPFTKHVHSDLASVAVRDAVAALAEDEGFHTQFVKNLFKRSSGKLELVPVPVRVPIEPTPGSVAVEIDGIYIGNSPLSRELHTGDAYRLRLSKPGFKPWEAVIRPEPGLTVSPELEPLSKSTNSTPRP